MTVQISAYGRQVADLHSKTTSKGTPMAMASMAVPLPRSQADDGTAKRGWSGYRRQRDQCANGAAGRQKRPAE